MKPVEYLASAHIQVTQSGTVWRLDSPQTHVTLDGETLALTLASKSMRWELKPSAESDLQVRVPQKGDHRYALRSASVRNVAPYQNGCESGLVMTLSGFGDSDLALRLFVTIEWPSEEVVCRACCQAGQTAMRELRWPAGLTPGFADAAIVPMMQGAMIPRDWPRKVWTWDALAHSRALYMPWWGFQKQRAALMTILETPDDVIFEFDHPAGGPTSVAHRWVPQLGRFGYTRSVRFKLFDTGNYVTMAHAYRERVQRSGHFVSLREKIARTPALQRLIGAPVIHTGAATHIEKESNYYNKEDEAANHSVIPFDQTAGMFRKLHQRGVRRAYVHLDGWGYRGYDNQHPDVIPPSPECGGWAGMQRLADTCERLGYLFAIHDQYRDYYLNASSYSPDHVVRNEDGTFWCEGYWFGGKQTLLCSCLAPAYVRRNHEALLKHGVKVRGSYLDVFSVVSMDECFSTDHPATRSDCLRWRAECLNQVRHTLGVVSSEEPSDWSIPYLDLVHHGPHSLDPIFDNGIAMGIPLPLFSLVYHDALIVPWFPGTHKGGWGIPNTDPGLLYALMHGGMPYLGAEAGAEEIDRVRRVCALQARLAHEQMVKHELLDAAGRKQRSTWSDGTVVTVDFDSGQATVAPEVTSRELAEAMNPVK